MQPKAKCSLAVCECLTDLDVEYCSEYCREAAAQGFERDFCLCSHCAGRKLRKPPKHTESFVVRKPTFAGPGSLTIEYSDEQDLRQQLISLATALESELEQRLTAAAGSKS